MKRNALRKGIEYFWGLNLRESIVVTFFGVLLVVSKMAIRIPLNIPGHSGLLWMTILTVCCLIIGKPGSGTLAGIISGLLAVLFGLGNEGFLTFFKYFFPGLFLDILLSILPAAARHWYTLAAVAAFSHWTKLLASYLFGLVLNLPREFLVIGLKVSTVNHLAFGFAAGAAAYFICSKTLLGRYITILNKGSRPTEDAGKNVHS